MLRRLHNHIFACKLKEIFESPLVLVYQTLGHVDHLGLKQQLQAGLAKDVSAQDAHVHVCHMKNSVASATGDDILSKLFTNSNLLVGFKLPQQQAQHICKPSTEQVQQQHHDAVAAATQKVLQSMRPQQAVGGLLQQQQQQHARHVPHTALKAFVETGVQLPTEQPLVLVGAFYQCSATPLARLKKWIKLDPSQVSGGHLTHSLTVLVNCQQCEHCSKCQEVYVSSKVSFSALCRLRELVVEYECTYHTLST